MSHDYLSKKDTPYPAEALLTLKRVIDQILEDADWNHNNDAHEKQWGLIFMKFCFEVRVCQDLNKVKVLNV